MQENCLYSGLFSPRINLSPFTKDFRGRRAYLRDGPINSQISKLELCCVGLKRERETGICVSRVSE